MNISRQEVRRYLGMRRTVDEETEKLIDECGPLVEQAADVRYVYRVFELTWEDGFPVIAGTRIPSKDLAKNLTGCRQAAILSVTLGIGVDRLIRKYENISMAKAAVMQAYAAAMTESACDDVNEKIREYAASLGYFTKPRYSPGYGDLSLENQKLIFSLIDLPREIGVTLNKSLLMSPFKSVTAYVGFSNEPCKTEKNCSVCDAADRCPYRQEVSG